MGSIIITKQQQYELQDLLEMWFNALPEVQDRIRIVPGQPRIDFYVNVRAFTTSECGLFNKRVGGEILFRFVTNPRPIHVWRGDIIQYTIHWEQF